MSFTDADRQWLRQCVPLGNLTDSNFEHLLEQGRFLEGGKGDILFREGDEDTNVLYLLSGEVRLLRDGQTMGSVKAGSEQARYALSSLKPRRFTGIAGGNARWLLVEAALQEKLLAWEESLDPTSDYVVEEVGRDGEASSDDDWMLVLLRQRALDRLPPSKAQALFLRLQAENFAAGHTVVEQGADGDRYYFVRSGRCQVVRDGVVVAVLGAGDSFGEEALLTRAPRNASVRMLEDGILMALSARDFEELLNKPLSVSVDAAKAKELMGEGAVLLDLRLAEEFARSRLRKAVSLPLAELRSRLDELDSDTLYICYSESDVRGQVGAYLLSERGYDACSLEGGLGALRGSVSGE